MVNHYKSQKISILVNDVFDGWSPKDTRLGGTEESVVEWANELTRREHYVRVYSNFKETGSYNGVEYLLRDEYSPMGVTLNVKCSEIDPQEPTWYFTNETDATKLDLSKFKGVIFPSKWAMDNIPVNNPEVRVVPHGYNSKEIYPSEKIPKQCFYASSPDRGLETVLEAWPKVYKAHPDASLILTYGVKETNLEGVIPLGDVSNDTMNQIYRTSDVWVHPANGGELFGMTGVKAQAAGCVPLYFPTMALKETVRHGVMSMPETFAQDWIELLEDEQKKSDIRSKLEAEDYPDWKSSTDILLETIHER